MCEFSIRVSRVSPSEVHEECLHRRFTRSVSIGDSRGVSPSKVHEECLHRRFTRSESVEGSRGVSLSEAHEEYLHRILHGSTTRAFQPEKTLDFRRGITQEGARLELGASVGGCSTEGRVVSVEARLDR
ncbi:hypothetical protein Tco_1573365, partial [Tanacetum coccineum]